MRAATSCPSTVMRTVKVIASGERGVHSKLSHGVFFGRFQREVEAGGFALAHIQADPATDVQRHTHDAAHFILTTRGNYITSAQGAPEVSTSPILVYNPPGTTHRDRFQRCSDGAFDGSFLTISIAPERMKGIAEQVALSEEPTVVQNVRASAVGARLVRELRKWEPGSPLVAEGICIELLASVARRQERSERTPPRWLSVAREMLRDCDRGPSVNAIAAECGVHPVHLSRTFRRFFGCSPGEYIRQNRVERAAALLRRTDLSLAEVALRSGYTDQSHLTHAFQSAFAITPTIYRRDAGIEQRDSGEVAFLQDGPLDET